MNVGPFLKNLRLERILCPNWVLCAILILALSAGILFEFYPLQSLEYDAYDLMAKQRYRQDSSPVVIVAIDDESLKSVGSWPWPRSYVADMISLLSTYSVDTLGLCLLYPDNELNPGLQEIQSLRETLGNGPSLVERKNSKKTDKNLKQTNKILKKIDGILAKAEDRLNHDAKLTSAVRSAVNVVLPIRFTLGAPAGKDAPEMSAWLKMNSLKLKSSAAEPTTKPLHLAGVGGVFKGERLAAGRITQPFTELSTKAGALGHINLIPDRDGVVRKAPLLISYQGRHFLSFALQMAAKKVGASTTDVKLKDDKNGFCGVRLKDLKIPTDRDYRMLIDYNPQGTNFTRFPFSHVLNKKVPANAFRDKIVLVGATAEVAAPLYNTTVARGVPGVEIAATIVENMVNGKYLVRPGWAVTVEVMVILYFGVFLLFVIPRVNPQVGALTLGLFIVTWVGICSLFFMAYGYWLKLVGPIFLSVFGYGVATYKRPAWKRQAESVELNKTLGLSLQGQGMLDMAFEKFLKCPVQDRSVKDLLYNLGLDFERKRMFNKALVVYEHILKAGNFKDIQDRIKKLKSIGDTVVLAAGSAGQDESLILGNVTTKPTLGRYEILKELGQGAMGTVYVGKDPKINREVAIKTLRYRELDQDQVAEVKKRFFREAEAAGKLSHPNIATIFDAGEDHDMAYMAMELINGSDLTEYCRKGTLLSVKRALMVVSSVADALGYAHGRGVIHRDIKPANIMLLKNDHVKVTDFGIARVVTSSKSKTQTGVVLGTPSYMSPEQVAGKKVDGRSDLFSLGVVFYELLTGEKPFKGDSIAALMYAVARASYTPIERVAPDIPSCCVAIVDKLLAKALSRRFKTADEAAKQARLCLEKLD